MIFISCVLEGFVVEATSLPDMLWITVVVVLAPLTVTRAGHAHYLGGDIQDLIDETKQEEYIDAVPAWIVRKPATEKQKRDSTNYNAKFTDIAKAYAEGYKAAIKAVQARAYIAKRRLLGIRPKSNIPTIMARGNPYLDKMPRSWIPEGTFKEPSGMQQSDTRVTKSTIPGITTALQIAKNRMESIVPDNQNTQISSMLNGITSTNENKENMVTKSTIPVPVPETKVVEEKSIVPSSNGFNMLLSSDISQANTQAPVNAMEEKSWVPHPSSSSDTPHKINERSAHLETKQAYHPAFPKVPIELRSEIERSKIAKMNARARHRNIYFDSAGGNPFNGGGVLSMQNAITKKHRRRRRRSVNENEYSPSMHLVRHRRSHMPYLGQNLDALGVIRALPKSWASPQKKTEELSNTNLPASSYAYLQPQPIEINPVGFNQFMAPTFRGTIPQPMAMVSSPMAINYGPMFPQQQQQPYPDFRSMIPGYPPFFNQMQSPLQYSFPSPLPNGIISEGSPFIESKSNQDQYRVRKSTLSQHDDGNP